MTKIINRKPLFATLGAVSALAVTAGAAYANIAAGETLGTSEDEIRAALEGKGYTVEEFEMEGDAIEVELAMDGKMFEAEIDPATGEVLEIEVEDGDEEDGDDD